MITITPSRLTEYTRDIFVAAGAPDATAGRLAGSLVLSNQSGHDSHGVIRIPQYIRGIREGQIDPKAEPTVVRANGAWAMVNGAWGFGHETARFAMGVAIERAREHGVGMVAAVRCNHIGRLGEWAEQAAAARMVGIACVGFGGGRAALVAPFGGAGRALATNPLAIGAPRAAAPPLLLDFATSILPEGKVRVAKEKGTQLPPGCLLDKDGRPTTDPNALYEGGVLLPFAGHKGYALSVMIEVLSMALSGADAAEAHAPTGGSSGAFFLAIDPEPIATFEEYGATVERMVERIKAVPPAPGFDEILLPGDPEHRARAERAEAIELPPATWEAIAEAARSVGVTAPAV